MTVNLDREVCEEVEAIMNHAFKLTANVFPADVQSRAILTAAYVQAYLRLCELRK